MKAASRGKESELSSSEGISKSVVAEEVLDYYGLQVGL